MTARSRGIVLAGLLLASLATVPVGSEPEAPVARFDWFTYEGRDPVFEQMPAGPRDYRNPILAGFYPDPSITRVGDEYYLVTSTFAYFPGVPIFRSRDLVEWTQIGHVLDRPSQLNLDALGISRGIFAPALRHHEGTFYMITTLVDGGGTFFVTAADPAGPWSDPVWLPEIDGIDPSLFFDDDGKVYVTNNGPPDRAPLYDGHRAIWIQELDLSAQRLIGPRTVIVDGGTDIAKRPIWIEAPHIFKKDGTYYLIAAEGGTGDQHSEVVFRSTAVRGPYEPYPGNPILTQRHLDPQRPNPVTSAGHADFVQTAAGDWWAVFLACRPYGDDLYNTGRETFLLPVRWIDGWPVITRGTERVPYVHRRPSLPPAAIAPVPTTGNFTLRDEFDGPELARYWTFIRTPRERWHDLTASPGWLTLRARPARIGGGAQPTFVGRRQQHAFASASTSMQFRPAAEGDRAGLVAFQNDEHFYFLGTTMSNGTVVVVVDRRAGTDAEPAPRRLASAPLPARHRGPLHLRIDARADRYDFSYALVPGRWMPLLEGADGTILSTKVAGGFVGTMLGLYASATRPSSATCAFEEGCDCRVPGITVRWKAAHCMGLHASDDLEHEGVSACVAEPDPGQLATMTMCERNAYWKERLCTTLHPGAPALVRTCLADADMLPRIVRHGYGGD